MLSLSVVLLKGDERCSFSSCRALHVSAPLLQLCLTILGSSTGRAIGCKNRESMAEKRTYADRRVYLIEVVRRRRKELRQRAIAHKGGCCQVCGYDRCMEALEFHHTSSSHKDFGISSKGYTRSWEKVREELRKCILVCANCHREIHAKLQPPWETTVEQLGEFREA